MDVTQDSARGEEPAVWEGEAEGSPEGVKPPEGAWESEGESPSPLDGVDSAVLLEALEPGEAAAGADDDEEGGDGFGNAEPEDESEEGPGQLAEEERRPPQRLSVRGLPAEQQFQLAEALDLVRRGEAGDVAEALELIKGEHPTSNVQHRTSKEEEVDHRSEGEAPGAEGLKERIAALRGERREAIEDFDRGAEARLTDEIEDLQLDLWRAEQAARVQEEQGRSYQEQYHSAVDAMEARYPEARDESSAFYRILDNKVAAAQAREDPALADPGFILQFADEVAGMLGGHAHDQGHGHGRGGRPRSRPPLGSALAPGYQTAARPGRDQLSRMIQEMPLEELERLVCTE